MAIHLEVAVHDGTEVRLDVTLTNQRDVPFEHTFSSNTGQGFRVVQKGLPAEGMVVRNERGPRPQISVLPGESLQLSFTGELTNKYLVIFGAMDYTVYSGEIEISYKLLWQSSNTVVITVPPGNPPPPLVVPLYAFPPPEVLPDTSYWSSWRHTLDNSRGERNVQKRAKSYSIIRRLTGLPFADFGDDVDRWLAWLSENDTNDPEEMRRRNEAYLASLSDEEQAFMHQCRR